MVGLTLVIFAVFLLKPPIQAPPPNIAEISPLAVERILDTPPEQATQFGKTQSGQGEAPGSPASPAASSPSPNVNPDGVVKPAVKRCTGNPPTQIEDPQSPPCVAFFEGDNGGATYRGVTANQIHIVWGTPGNSTGAYGNDISALMAFFNKRFETYGRTVVIDPNPLGDQYLGAGDPATQQSDALKIYKETNTFAALYYSFSDGYYFDTALANFGNTGKPGEITIVPQAPIFGDDVLNSASYSPFLWQYNMSLNRELSVFADYVCSRWGGGQPARFAGTNGSHGSMASTPRKFGVLLTPDPYVKPPATGDLVATMRACGLPIVPSDIITHDAVNNTAADIVTDVQRFQADNVTSVISIGDSSGITVSRYATVMDSQSYGPEWMTGTFGGSGDVYAYYLENWPTDQRNRVFGLTFSPKIQNAKTSVVLHAEQEGGYAGAQNTSNYNASVGWEYRGLLMLFSGIQMAGPNLTAESFSRALERTRFPNPETQPPLYEGAVQPGPGNHSFTADAAEVYVSDTAPNDLGGTGSICFIDHGTRRSIGAFPKGDQPYHINDATCDTGQR